MTKTHKSLLTSLAALTAALSAPTAQAAGTAAGTIIVNTATGTFTNGSTTSTVQSNTVSLRVDEVLDVTVASLSGSTIQVGSGSVTVPFRITNTGNGPEAFKVTAIPVNAGNQFTPVVQAIVLDTNGNRTYDPGVDQALISGATTASLGANGTLDAFVILTLPAGATDGQTAQIRLTAEAATGSGTPGTIFAAKGQGGGDAVVGATGALAGAANPLIASSISLAIAKTATIVDPYGHSEIIPGSVVTFQIVANFTGTGSASNAHITDVIPANTTYQNGSLKLDGVSLTDVADADAGVASASGIDVTLGSVSGGTTKTVKFDVKVN